MISFDTSTAKDGRNGSNVFYVEMKVRNFI